MATRKIRLTMSGAQVDGQGPIVDIDFNGVNLDTDIDVNSIHGESTITKEYSVDVDAGTFNLNIEYKNDVGDNGDRNLYIDTIEVANDGTTYEPWFVTPTNSNLLDVNIPVPMCAYNPQMDDAGNRVPNPDYDNTIPFTDGDDWWESGRPTGRWPGPGNNSRFIYDAKTGPLTIFENKVVTLNITFA